MDSIQETQLSLFDVQAKIDENAQKVSSIENEITANSSRITENMQAFISLDEEEHTELKEELTEVESINADMVLKISSYDNEMKVLMTSIGMNSDSIVNDESNISANSAAISTNSIGVSSALSNKVEETMISIVVEKTSAISANAQAISENFDMIA